MILALKLFLLVSIAFLVSIHYRSSKLQNRLESCFTCQSFNHGIIGIIKEINISHVQSELTILDHFLLILLSGDTSLNAGPFGNPELFKHEEW